MDKKEIDKPWCLYGMCSWWGVGKIVEEQKGALCIINSEKDECRPWDPNYVKRFASLKEAIEEYAKHKEQSFAGTKEKALEDFPSENIG